MVSFLKISAWLPLPRTRRQSPLRRVAFLIPPRRKFSFIHPDISHPDAANISTLSGCLTTAILSGQHLTYSDVSQLLFCPADIPLIRVSHSRNYIRPTFHLLRIFHIRRLPLDGRGGQLNFPGQTCPDPSVTLIRITSVADNSDSPDSLARQILAIRRIHFCPQ